MTDNQRREFNELCKRKGGKDGELFRAVADFITHLEDDNARLVNEKNELVREGWVNRESK